MSYSHLARANDLEPSEGHHRLRTTCPYHVEDHDPPFGVVSRYEDVVALLKQPTVWRNGEGPGVNHSDRGVLGGADGTDHARHRRALRQAFRPSVVAAMAPRVDELCDQWWDAAFSEPGEGDFVELFAFPFPAVVVAELLGVPDDRREDFRRWSDDIVAVLGGGDRRRGDRANEGVFAIIGDAAAERMALADAGAPLPDDLVSVMVEAHRAGQIGWSELLLLGHQVLVAGHETTAGLIAAMLYRLAVRPDLVDLLRRRPDLLDGAVEEFVRFDSPVQGLFRTSDEDQHLLGQQVPAHRKVQLLFASANRDPDAFPEPDTIDVGRYGRGGRPHLGFGWGLHYCIGAPLARREARAALERIVHRFDTVELLGEPTVNAPFILRGFTAMPIRWTVRA